MTTDPYQFLTTSDAEQKILGPNGKPTSSTPAGPVAEKERRDSVQNVFSGLNTAEDRHRFTEVDSREALSCEELDRWYETGRYVPRICDQPARDAVDAGFHIVVARDDVPPGVETTELDEDHDEEGVAVLGARLRDLGIQTDCFDSIRFARAYGGSVMITITDDSAALDEPVQNMARVKSTHVFDRYEVTPHNWITDIEDEHYGDPEGYVFHPDERGGPATRGGEPLGPIIHRDRVIRFEGRRLRDGRDGTYNGWGQPIPDMIQEVVYDLESAIGGGASAADRFHQDVLKIKGLMEKLASVEGRDQIKERAKLMEMVRSFIHTIILDADAEEYQTKNINFGSLVEFIGILKEDLSAVSRFPLSKLFGQMPAGLSSNDDTGTENYNSFVQSEIQGQKLTPAIRHIARLLFQEKGSGWAEIPDFKVLWGPMDEGSEKERAETEQIRQNTEKARAERHQADIQSSVISPTESREARYPELVEEEADETPSFAQIEQARQELRADGQPIYADGGEARLDAPRVRASDGQPEKQRKRDVGYTNSSPGVEECRDCSYYRPPENGEGSGDCAIVRGTVAPSGWCRLWGTAAFAAGLEE